MNIIFLDIDGVLNNLGSALALGSYSNHFDPISVKLVDALAENGNANIVVSSAWRTGDLELTKQQIEVAGGGILLPHILGETDWMNPPYIRGDEIRDWIHSSITHVKTYVILDDNDDMLPGQPLVQTTFEDGFRFKHYIAALRILNPDHIHVRSFDRTAKLEGDNK